MSRPQTVRPFRPPKKSSMPFCPVCGDRATQEVLIDMKDYVASQKYCDKCIAHVDYDEMV